MAVALQMLDVGTDTRNEAIDANDVVALREQGLGKMRADEPGGAGDQDSHMDAKYSLPDLFSEAAELFQRDLGCCKSSNLTPRPVRRLWRSFIDAPKETGIVLQAVVEPFILCAETDQHAGRFAVAGDDNLLCLGFA